MSNSPPDSSFAASEPQNEPSSPSRHDSSILSQDMPPAGVNDSFESEAATEKHPKGKRKRTAAKDKMILEEAYKANPKPDKQARLDIVNRVSLNEKEVQIWFQNRRQNDRRKSRPLSPQELAALRFNGLHGVPTDPMSMAAGVPNAEIPVTMAAHAPTNPQAMSPSQPSSQPVPSPAQLITATPRATGHANPQLPETTPQNRDLSSSQSSQDCPPSVAHSFSSSVGYLANRWNIGSSFSTPAGQIRDADESPRCVQQSCNPFMPMLIKFTIDCLPHPLASRIRLTMLANGRANPTSDSRCHWKAKLSSWITRLHQRVPLRKNTQAQSSLVSVA
ncbi:hypothetical protein NLG97_g6531 [Lecanicillium saksenae]|uniref:Uncharacterized protein n=1 Tax=Lecanicillium saksenae TaxID=468837 RepID=A0ACC1QRY3_9HYPO|nr:hypothetical protein NLG97_g6531 [Lecanicillium saksenae]